MENIIVCGDALKPYYSEDGITIYHGDCLDILKQLDPVDFILTDPPYGTTSCKWDSVIPLEPMWEQLKWIIKLNGTIVMTASQPFTTILIASNIKMFKYCWVWDKMSHTNPFVAKYRPLTRHEDIAVFSRNKTTYNPQKYFNGIIRNDRGQNGKRLNELFVNKGIGYKRDMDGYANPHTIITIPRESIKGSNEQRNYNSLHPTQKPVALMKYLIKTYTNKNEIVLDFAMGSGTTLVAAKQLGRRAIGIEISEKYCETAMQRLAQMELFA